MQRITSWLLIGLCLQLFIPRALWHELANHHDTNDRFCNEHANYISTAHEHCLIFDLIADPVPYQEVKKILFVLLLIGILIFYFTSNNTDSLLLSFSNKGPPIKK